MAESPSTLVSVLVVATLPLVLAITINSSEAARENTPSAFVFRSWSGAFLVKVAKTFHASFNNVLLVMLYS